MLIMQVEFSRLPASERISSREFSASQRLKRKGERRRAKSTAWRPRTGRDPRTHRSGTGGRRGLAARRTSSRCSQTRFDLTTCMPSAHETHTVGGVTKHFGCVGGATIPYHITTLISLLYWLLKGSWFGAWASLGVKMVPGCRNDDRWYIHCGHLTHPYSQASTYISFPRQI